ncbi:MAG: amidohydrolase family protein, partial [Synergistota bacterium]|nr:amidohydrolase family protein [Synergistota bacterium]
MYDVLIKGGTVIDGTGAPGFISDVAISGGKIASIARCIEEGAKTVIDAGGLCVTPGFIDTHSHSDLMLLDNPHLEEKVRQGVTTEILGQDGLGLAPLTSAGAKEMLQEHLAGLLGTPNIEWDWSSFAEYLKRYSRKGIINNIGALASHGAVRIAVMGMEDRHASRDELNRMKEILDECMCSGALGLSTGLIYPPCCYAAFDELVELCKVVAGHSGALVVHVRNEADSIMDA